MDAELGDIDPVVTSLVAAPALTGPSLAGLVDEHLAALWRGDEAADHPFFAWLSASWRPDRSPEPAKAAAARSILAAGGLGIRWFETPGAIVGYIPGHGQGHYRISPFSNPPGAEAGASTTPRPEPAIDRV